MKKYSRPFDKNSHVLCDEILILDELFHNDKIERFEIMSCHFQKYISAWDDWFMDII